MGEGNEDDNHKVYLAAFESNLVGFDEKAPPKKTEEKRPFSKEDCECVEETVTSYPLQEPSKEDSTKEENGKGRPYKGKYDKERIETLQTPLSMPPVASAKEFGDGNTLKASISKRNI